MGNMANENRLIDASVLIRDLTAMKSAYDAIALDGIIKALKEAPIVDAVEMEDVAEMLRVMFDDDCACNYNGNDEWLPCLCKYAETDCPMPKERLGCWIEFVKHWRERREDNGR